MAVARASIAQVAARLARRMPFVHHPGDATIDQVEPGFGGALRSPKLLGRPPARRDVGARLRNEHVFAYAGPCCYVKDKGVVALYFRPAVEKARDGAVCRYDSGALCEPDPCLQPRATELEAGKRTLSSCLSLVARHSQRLASWRARFETWLLDCYGTDPARYLETSADPYADGTPDCTEPGWLRRYNGKRGKRFPRRADRRAWTWEARFQDPVPFSFLRLVHVGRGVLQDAIDAFPNVDVRAVSGPAGARALYEESGALLRELTS